MTEIAKGNRYESPFFGTVTVISVDAWSVWFRDETGYRDSLSYETFRYLFA